MISKIKVMLLSLYNKFKNRKTSVVEFANNDSKEENLFEDFIGAPPNFVPINTNPIKVFCSDGKTKTIKFDRFKHGPSNKKIVSYEISIDTNKDEAVNNFLKGDISEESFRKVCLSIPSPYNYHFLERYKYDKKN